MPERIKHGVVLNFMTNSKSEHKVDKIGGIACDGLILDCETRDAVAFEFDGKGIKIIARAVGSEEGDMSLRLSLYTGGTFAMTSTGTLCVKSGQTAENAFGDEIGFSGTPYIPRDVTFLSKVRVAQLNVGDTVQLTTSSFDNIDKLWVVWYYQNFSDYIDCSNGKKYVSCARNIDDTKQRVYSMVLNLNAANKTVTLESQCYVEQTAESFSRTAVTTPVNIYLLT